jgi:chromosome segregation ATPase
MAKLEMAEPPNGERSFKYWEARVYRLEERVHVLENRYRNEDDKHRELIGEITKVMDKVEVIDLRQDLLAGNLVDVRERVKELHKRLNTHDERFDGIDERLDGIDKRFEQVDKRFEQVDGRFEQVDKRFEGIETTQAEHGVMLQQILERLPSPN